MSPEEREIVPYEAHPLEGERVLVIAPHPDDEVIGCGGALARLARERREVHVLVLTDGAAGVDRPSPGDVEKRERESRAGLAILGVRPPEFLRLPDRQLGDHSAEVAEAIRQRLDRLRPDLLLVPSPLDLHPDHHAVADLVTELFPTGSELSRWMGPGRIAFYETSQTLRPNTLVDITELAELKFTAIRAHQSQQQIRDYAWFSRGLAQYRALTLSAETRYAEAYYVVELSTLEQHSWPSIIAMATPAIPVRVTREPLPVSTIIRTRNRLPLLREAVASVRGGSHPTHLVIVNDGGESPKSILDDLDRVTLVEHDSSRGRAEAMNAGVRAAETRYVAFLDDDDVHYPDHLAVLANAVQESPAQAWYTDAVSVPMSLGPDGTWLPGHRARIYAQDFDRDLLLFDNYIPLLTLLVEREDFLRLDGFDPKFDLFEDWDFLIRLSRLGDFRRIPKTTGEIRHYQSSGSAVLESPEGSESFRQARIAIWQRHRDLLTDAAMAGAFGRQKQRLVSAQSHLVEQGGRIAHLGQDIARLEREKGSLLESMSQEHEAASGSLHQLGGRLHQAETEIARVTAELERAAAEHESMRRDLRDLQAEIEERDRVLAEKDETLSSTWGEIERLNGLLEQIYGSRTWKLHQWVEKVRGH